MRIVGGKYKGRVLSNPSGQTTRPTSDRAREAIFNILEHTSKCRRPPLLEAHVLDLFAGTGALGLESLSRGAKEAVFIEKDRAAAALCKKNIESLGFEDQGWILAQDALAPRPRPAHIAPRNLVFLDPPYGKNLGTPALQAFLAKDWLAPDAIAVFEMAKESPESLPQGFILRDERRYGVAQVWLLERE